MTGIDIHEAGDVEVGGLRGGDIAIGGSDVDGTATWEGGTVLIFSGLNESWLVGGVPDLIPGVLDAKVTGTMDGAFPLATFGSAGRLQAVIKDINKGIEKIKEIRF